MENHSEEYISRLHFTAYGVGRGLLADILLFVLIAGVGLAMISTTA
ncbi:hypothetical protein [Rhizobium bangladeshense]|nr:hypothetical protein [Rhizobium bangladeshense]